MKTNLQKRLYIHHFWRPFFENACTFPNFESRPPQNEKYFDPPPIKIFFIEGPYENEKYFDTPPIKIFFVIVGLQQGLLLEAYKPLLEAYKGPVLGGYKGPCWIPTRDIVAPQPGLL